MKKPRTNDYEVNAAPDSSKVLDLSSDSQLHKSVIEQDGSQHVSVADQSVTPVIPIKHSTPRRALTKLDKEMDSELHKSVIEQDGSQHVSVADQSVTPVIPIKHSTPRRALTKLDKETDSQLHKSVIEKDGSQCVSLVDQSVTPVIPIKHSTPRRALKKLDKETDSQLHKSVIEKDGSQSVSLVDQSVTPVIPSKHSTPRRALKNHDEGRKQLHVRFESVTNDVFGDLDTPLPDIKPTITPSNLLGKNSKQVGNKLSLRKQNKLQKDVHDADQVKISDTRSDQANVDPTSNQRRFWVPVCQLSFKAKLYKISSDTHLLQLIKLRHFKLERFKSI